MINNLKDGLVSSDRIKAGVENGSRLFLESFQYPIWNKNVICS